MPDESGQKSGRRSDHSATHEDGLRFGTQLQHCSSDFETSDSGRNTVVTYCMDAKSPIECQTHLQFVPKAVTHTDISSGDLRRASLNLQNWPIDRAVPLATEWLV